jgi:hypothetical protein
MTSETAAPVTDAAEKTLDSSIASQQLEVLVHSADAFFSRLTLTDGILSRVECNQLQEDLLQLELEFEDLPQFSDPNDLYDLLDLCQSLRQARVRISTFQIIAAPSGRMEERE